jgi:hypothetical protein
VTTIEIVLKNSACCVLDRHTTDVDDPQDVTRHLIETIQRNQWVLGAGDVIQIEEVS